MSAPSVPVDPHLMARFRATGASITWRPVPSSAPDTRARLAHLHDEEGRVEERQDAEGVTWVADAGPVGALVLLLVIDRQGSLPYLASVPAGSDPEFPQGGISARWPSPAGRRAEDAPLPVQDLVTLARYALL